MNLRRLRQQAKYLLIGKALGALSRHPQWRTRRLFHPHLVTEPPEGPILVLAPHPDDETLGIGGTLLLAAAAGRHVQVAIITDGAQGHPDPARQGPDLVAIRRAEAEAAREVLGLPPFRYLEQPDSNIDTTRLQGQLAALLREVQPASILTPFPIDYHHDHVLTTRGIVAAAEEVAWDGAFWCYEATAPILPNTVIEVTSVIEQKIAATRAYTSQMETNDYVASFVEGVGRYRSFGLLAGKGYAEGFFVCDREFLGAFLESLPEDL